MQNVIYSGPARDTFYDCANFLTFLKTLGPVEEVGNWEAGKTVFYDEMWGPQSTYYKDFVYFLSEQGVIVIHHASIDVSGRSNFHSKACVSVVGKNAGELSVFEALVKKEAEKFNQAKSKT